MNVLTRLLLIFGVAKTLTIDIEKMPKKVLPYVPEKVSKIIHNYDPFAYNKIFSTL